MLIGDVLDIAGACPDKPPQHRFNCMSTSELGKTIDAAFERREVIGPTTKGAVRRFGRRTNANDVRRVR